MFCKKKNLQQKRVLEKFTFGRQQSGFQDLCLRYVSARAPCDVHGCRAELELSEVYLRSKRYRQLDS